MDARTLVAREQEALRAHRASLRGGALPPPKQAPRGTFIHGLLLPFSLFFATLRQPALRTAYVRLVTVRAGLLFVVAALALLLGDWGEKGERAPKHKGVVVSYAEDDEGHDDGDDDDKGPDEPVNVDVPGIVHVHIDKSQDAGEIEVLGKKVPIRHAGRPVAQPQTPPPPATRYERIRNAITKRWKILVAFVGFLSLVEGVIVFFSRRWDDWLSFYISPLAGIRPESPEPPRRAVSFDVKWILRKLRRRIRGYLIFASGMPILYLFKLVPVVGTWIFAVTATAWAWYWVGVFTASKSAHAWADEGKAPPPVLVRSFNAPFARGWWCWPMRTYGRVWARIVRDLNSAAAVFDRSPAPFLGLALARAILALPFLYLVARPIVPVAAGRLCAETDPNDRFVAPPASDAPQVRLIPPSIEST